MATSPPRWRGIYLDIADELHALLTKRLPVVYAAQRAIEMETSFEGRVAANNLIDVLAHISELLLRAESMSREEQNAHVVNIGDHLRRAIIEGEEEVVNDLLDTVGHRWNRYIEVSHALHVSPPIPGVRTHQQLQEARAALSPMLNNARAAKPEESWESAVQAGALFREAAEAVQQLLDDVNAAIGAAEFRLGEIRRTEDQVRADAAKATALRSAQSSN